MRARHGRLREALGQWPALCVAGALLGAALLPACGGSSGGASASPSTGHTSPAPAVAPRPVATYGPGGSLPVAAEDTLRHYFAAVASGDAAAARALLAPTSPLGDNPTMGITALRQLRIYRRPLPGPPPGTSAIPMVDAYVEAGPDTAWGPPSRHTFFMTMIEAPAGTWAVWSMASGP